MLEPLPADACGGASHLGSDVGPTLARVVSAAVCPLLMAPFSGWLKRETKRKAAILAVPYLKKSPANTFEEWILRCALFNVTRQIDDTPLSDAL